MAASYDGDGNRIFQISCAEAEEYVNGADMSYASDTPKASGAGKVTLGEVRVVVQQD